MFPMSFNTLVARLSGSLVDVESSKFSIDNGDVTRILEFNGTVVEAEEFDEDVEEDDADCGNVSCLDILCFIVPAFSFAKGILSIESIDEFD